MAETAGFISKIYVYVVIFQTKEILAEVLPLEHRRTSI